MSFVEPPGTMHRYPHQVHLIQNEPERPDSSLENGSESDIKTVTFLFQGLTGIPGFGNSLPGQIDISPTRKLVFQIPDTFTMPQKYKLHCSTLMGYLLTNGLHFQQIRSTC